MKYSKLTFIEARGTRNHYRMWLCQCDCGTIKEFYASNVKYGRSKSCGCLTLTNKPAMTHGMSKTPIYHTWNTMLSRCKNRNSTGFRKYGAKGILVCDEWSSFEQFYADMGDKPTPHHTLDRIDPTGHYEPSNCRWATQKEQQNNRGNNHRITLQGRTQTLMQWCEEFGIGHTTVLRRIKVGWEVEDALTMPLQKGGPKPASLSQS